MHHKFFVIDSRIVVTGSYNWTSGAATRNMENVVVLDSRVAAREYGREFETLFGSDVYTSKVGWDFRTAARTGRTTAGTG